MLSYGLLVILGIVWICIGSARAQIYGDAHLAGRAVAKIAVGFAVMAAWHVYRWEIPWKYQGWISPEVQVIELWCWATGLTKLLICMRQPPRLTPGSTPDVYGPARPDGFRQGVGLQSSGTVKS